MKDFEKKFLDVLKHQKHYDLNFKSNHWNYQINKKKIYSQFKISKILDTMIYQKVLMINFTQLNKQRFFSIILLKNMVKKIS